MNGTGLKIKVKCAYCRKFIRYREYLEKNMKIHLDCLGANPSPLFSSIALYKLHHLFETQFQ